MMQVARKLGTKCAGLALLALATLNASAFAQEASVEERLAALEGQGSAYVDNSYLFLIGGLIVMFMAAGFLCLEAGLVRSKNCLLYTSPSPRDQRGSRMPSSA